MAQKAIKVMDDNDILFRERKNLMKATRYMRKPFIVTGYKVDEDNMDAIARWCEGHVIRDAERPFIRVPVNRPTNRRQTEAYVGTSVLLSEQRGEKSFKVYTDDWLEKHFMAIPEEIDMSSTDDVIEEPAVNHSCCAQRDNVRPLPAQPTPKTVRFRAAN